MGETSGSIPDRPILFYNMPGPYKLERQFAGVSYPTVEALAKHAGEISQIITAKPDQRRSTAPKTPLMQNRLSKMLMALAPLYAKEKDPHRKIAEHLLREDGKPLTTPAVEK